MLDFADDRRPFGDQRGNVVDSGQRTTEREDVFAELRHALPKSPLGGARSA